MANSKYFQEQFQVPSAIVTSEISLWADPLIDSSQKVLGRDAFESR